MGDYRIGIIGGSGLYEMPGLTVESEAFPDTPWGHPSGPVVLGDLAGRPVAFLARHGPGHVHSPSEVPYAANIYALKRLGVRWIISISAVGSLRERIAPRHFVIPDQVFDRTTGIRTRSFFGSGVAGHVSFADPFCETMRKLLVDSSREAGATVHGGGCYVCMEGPQFSTRSESNVYRGLGMDIIGMTVLPEAKLAREAGICFGTVAMVTDYDVWRSPEEEVTIEMVIRNMEHNTAIAKKLIPLAIERIGTFEERDCPCVAAGRDAIITSPSERSAATMEALEVVLEP